MAEQVADAPAVDRAPQEELMDGREQTMTVSPEMAKHIDSWAEGADFTDPDSPLAGPGLTETPGEAAEAEDEVGDSSDTDPVADSGTGDDDDTDPTEEVSAVDLDPFRSLLPGATIETPDDLQEHVKSLTETKTLYDQFNDYVNSDDNIYNYLVKVMQEGMSPEAAALEVFGKLATEPDPDEDPVAYAKFREAKKETEMTRKQREKDEAKAAEMTKARQQDLERVFTTYAAQEELDEAQQKELAQTYASMIGGDPVTGRFRADAFKIIHKGMNHDRLVREAVKKALGDDEVRTKESKRKRKPRNITPRPGSGGGGRSLGEPKSDAQKELDAVASRLHEPDVYDELGIKPWKPS